MNFNFSKINDLHIWLAYLPKEHEMISYYTFVLSDDEKERSCSFKFLEDQRKYTLSRGILRCLLGKYLELKPENIEILYGLWGKPCLHNKFSLRFNLSRSNDYVIYVLSPNYEVGIDIEYLDAQLDVDTLAPNIFLSEYEKDYWHKIDKNQNLVSFYKFWTSKEAFLKAYGKGFLAEDNSSPPFLIDFLKKGIDKSYVDNRYFYLIDFITDYIGTIVIDKAPGINPIIFSWSL